MHFAYPNVIPRTGEFIGCGRYRIFPNDCSRVPENYTSHENTPNTPNRLGVEHAMQVLAPNAYNKANCIYATKDDPQQRYQGNSLDLAYLLAHVYRERELKYKLGDVWCTGSVHVNEGLPVLRKVDDTGFQLKLNAFLSPKNKDYLFIVPAANVTNTIIENITEKNAQIYSLSQSNKIQLKAIKEGKKTIIKALPHELTLLVETLFVQQQGKRRGRKAAFMCLTLLVLFSSLGYLYFHWPFLTEMDRVLASDPLGTREKRISQQNQSLIPVNRSSIAADIGFIYRQGSAGKQQTLDTTSNLFSELMLSHRDFYRLSITPKDQKKAIYLYLYQFDSQGEVSRLFPNSMLGNFNPVTPENFPVTIPGREGEWLYLSKLDPEIKGVIREHLLFFASYAPLVELERLIDNTTSKGGEKLSIPDALFNIADKLSENNNKATHVSSSTFWHTQ